ncbi:B3/B4 domain-containing protein [Actinokineospora spheciospongiae]|uniref:B3/B4 domain-containing protein n=1 Tax=Actinokineospora spheciospongiae TaxID=909613 RepID=UPI000D7128C8|nr:phenylalanine--tRNA ligase beta subunit-related protein [Actinokineospora spheciospongiae]PWW58255.1 DNA/RNA-binding domain of Phe-tRNA-synthetase-like protein [Actinokineospora spheciospongiae]
MSTTATPTGVARVAVEPPVFELVPGYTLGLVVLPTVDVLRSAQPVDDLLTRAEDDIHRTGWDRGAISALPSISGWRRAYQSFGVNPNRFPCAAESLLRRVAKGARLPRINTVVDLCNAISLSTRLPVASCAVDDVRGVLEVRRATGDEVFLPLDAPDAPEHPDRGEVVYADGEGRAHSRRWNWRQGFVVKTDVGPHRLLLTVEAAHDGAREAVEDGLAALLRALPSVTTAAPGSAVLDASVPAIELTDKSGGTP